MSVPRPLLVAWSLVLALGTAPVVAAQTTAEPAPQSKAGGTVVLEATRPDGMLFSEFIDWIAGHVDRPFTYTPAARQLTASPSRRIRFDRAVRLPRSEVLRFGRKVLFAHKIAIVEMGGGPTSYYLVESMDTPAVLQGKRRFVTEKELADLREDYVLVACTVRVENIAVQQIQTQVQRLITQATVYGSSVIPMPSENAFLVIDFAPNACSTAALIRSLDVKAARPMPLPPHPATLKAIKEVATLKRRVAALEKSVAKLGGTGK